MNRMTCQEFDEIVHGFVRMELLDVALREATLDHAAHCSNCAERMAEARLLAEASEAAAQSVREQQTPPDVEVALLAAFQNLHRRTVWWRTFEWAVAGVAAAVLLVILWSSAVHVKGLPSPRPSEDASQSKAPLEVSGPKSSQSSGVAEGAQTQIENEGAGESYALADFVPVPFTEAMGLQDEGMVVRVQLTRSSLAELGYPVAAMPDDDLIRADVLVGEDGWPRGVKLAQ